jgi:nicotinamide mononucleotide transporter
VRRASPALLAGTTVAIGVATLILVPVLRAAHGAAPGWDALTTSMSLGAQLLLNLKRLETWYVWIAVDVIYVPLYFSRDLNLTALVYIVFLALCIQGWRQWRTATV